MVDVAELEAMGFVRSGSILYDPKTYKISFSTNLPAELKTAEGIVYLWCEETDKSAKNRQLDVKYVGETSKTWPDRQKTHLGGMNSGLKTLLEMMGTQSEEPLIKGRGALHRRNIKASLAEGSSISLWLKQAGVIDFPIYGVMKVTLCKAEELALWRKFRPIWNKA